MPGQATIGGGASGGLVGNMTVGPSTRAGKEQTYQALDVTLAANTVYSVPVPAGMVGWVAFFTFPGAAASIPALKVWTNLDAGEGMTVGAEAFASGTFAAGTTELKFKAVSPPGVFQLFIH